MDILTPKGQETLRKERAVIAAWPRLYPGFLYIETDKERDAVNDGIIVKAKTNTIVAVCETKCRGSTIEQFDNWNREWLITYKKIKRNAFLAREMRVFFTGIMYLAPSNILLVKNLYDGNADKWLVDFRTDKTETQQTVNGGRVVRENAFIDMRGAREFTVES